MIQSGKGGCRRCAGSRSRSAVILIIGGSDWTLQISGPTSGQHCLYTTFLSKGDNIVRKRHYRCWVMPIFAICRSKCLRRSAVECLEFVTEVGFISETQFCDNRGVFPSFRDELPSDAAPQAPRPRSRGHVECACEKSLQSS